MANTGLSVNDAVSVAIQLSPQAAQTRNFGSLLILGDSDVIDVQERERLYTSAASIGADFGQSAPEYQAALLFFGQSPQPSLCYIGRWAASATHGTLRGGVLSAAQQAIGNFNTISSGGLSITIDGTLHQPVGINLTSTTNLNGVASALQASLGGSATVTWDANNACFWVKSASTGTSSSVTVASAPPSGADLSVTMRLTAATDQYSVAGIASETIEASVSLHSGLTSAWYGLQIAATTAIADVDYVSVAGIIQAQTVSRIFGVTTQEAGALSATSTTDLPYLLQQAGYFRAFCQYSSSSPYASASIFGRAFTVNFNGSNTTITLKWKQEPGIVPEYPTETQAAALAAKNCNVFVEYNNATAILQQGTMANGYWFDEVHGTDWLQNAIQTDVYNLLYTSPTKIPLTDPGVGQIVAVVTADLEQAIVNGLGAPGVWTGPNIGALVSGQTLAKGYYVYAPPVSTLTQAQRSARQTPVIQCALKLAGAVHFANLIVSVNQ